MDRMPKIGVVIKIEESSYSLAPGPTPRSLSLTKQVEGSKPYTVSLVPGSEPGGPGVRCTCNDSSLGLNRCKHAFAVLRLLRVLAAEAAGEPVPPPSQTFGDPDTGGENK